MLDSVEDFRALALSFASQSTSDEYIAQIDRIVREIEIWSNLNAKYLVGDIPEQECLDLIRHDWISGMPLSEIIKMSRRQKKSQKITMGLHYRGLSMAFLNCLIQYGKKPLPKHILQLPCLLNWAYQTLQAQTYIWQEFAQEVPLWNLLQ